MMRVQQLARGVLASLVLVVGCMHGMIQPVGEWFSISVLGAWEETARVRSESLLRSLLHSCASELAGLNNPPVPLCRVL